MGAVLTGAVSGLRLHAQSQAAIFGKPSGPKFQVASIQSVPDLQNLLRPGPGPRPHAGIKLDAAGVDIAYWSIAQLILRAYGLHPNQLSGPDWMDSLRFNIFAKFPVGATQDQLPEMLQWLLVERFGLVAHGETKNLPAFALLVGNDGPKMKPAAPDADAPAEPAAKNVGVASRRNNVGLTLDSIWGMGPNGPLGVTTVTTTGGGGLHLEIAKMPMDVLALVLGAYLGGPVIDKTGLEGKYQVIMDFSLVDTLGAAGHTPGEDAPGVASEPLNPSLFSAVQRLGLRLERRTAPITLLIVDHVEQVPKGN